MCIHIHIHTYIASVILSVYLYCGSLFYDFFRLYYFHSYNIYTYIHMHMYMYMYVCVDVCVYVYVYVCMYIYIYTYIHTYVCIYIYTYIHTCVYIYIYIYMCVCIYIYIYIHITCVKTWLTSTYRTSRYFSGTSLYHITISLLYNIFVYIYNYQIIILCSLSYYIGVII